VTTVTEMRGRIGAVRFLALLFGQLPTDREYTADSDKWSSALLRLRDRHVELEDLFDELTFSKKPGCKPYSPEVSKFLIRLRAGTVVQVVNSGLVRLQISSEIQKEMYEFHAKKVDSGILPIVRQLADELAKDNDVIVIR